MGLYVSTTGVSIEIKELGIVLEHPTLNYPLSEQFSPEDLRNATVLTTLIRDGDLSWKKSIGGDIEPALDYDPDVVDIDNENTGDGKQGDRVVTFKDLQQQIDREKQAIVAGSSFAGNPKVYNVVFSTPYTDSNYVILIDSAVPRVWTFENKDGNGFTINSNANKEFTETVNWNTRHI